MDTIIQVGDSNTIIVDNDQLTTINTSSTITYTIISSPDQQMQSGTTNNFTAAGLINSDIGNNLTIGSDGRLMQLPKLASTNW